MFRLRTAALVLLACSACGRPSVVPGPTESIGSQSPTPTPFLPRGFVGVGTTPPPVETNPGGPSASLLAPLADLANDLALALIRLREAQGLAGLTTDPGLSRLAEEIAGRLASLQTPAHAVDPSGENSAQVGMSTLGFHGALAELVVSVRQDLDDPVGAALQAWLTDPANRNALLAREHRHLGVGVAGDGTWLYLVCVLAESGPFDEPADREDDLDQ